MPTTRLATIWHVNDKSLSVRQTNPIANVLRYKSLSSLCWCVYCTFHDYLQKLNWTHECTKLNMWSLVSKRTWIFPSVRRPLSALSMRIFLTEDSLQKMFRAWTKPRWKHLFVQLYRMPEVTNVKIWSRVYTRALLPWVASRVGLKRWRNKMVKNVTCERASLEENHDANEPRSDYPCW